MYYPIIIGGSAGSFSILLKIIPVLNSDFHFPLIFCIHRHKTSTGNFVPALEKKEGVIVLEAEEGAAISPGHVYIAPANNHLTFTMDKHFLLNNDPPQNYSRPSIDITFQSAAKVFGNKIIGILLSGANADGALGLKAMHDVGGITIVQDPSDAEISVMPQAAIDCFQPNHILSADKIINFIENLVLHL